MTTSTNNNTDCPISYDFIYNRYKEIIESDESTGSDLGVFLATVSNIDNCDYNWLKNTLQKQYEAEK